MLNLEVELIKKGTKQNRIPKLIAETLGCSERTIRNKLDGKSSFTVIEAFKINYALFSGSGSIDLLFSPVPETGNEQTA